MYAQSAEEQMMITPKCQAHGAGEGPMQGCGRVLGSALGKWAAFQPPPLPAVTVVGGTVAGQAVGAVMADPAMGIYLGGPLSTTTNNTTITTTTATAMAIAMIAMEGESLSVVTVQLQALALGDWHISALVLAQNRICEVGASYKLLLHRSCSVTHP